MKRTILSARDHAWLADTIARNRAKFAGWTMTEKPSGDGPPADPLADQPPPADPPPPPAADADKDLGFPKDTPVAEMKAEQQAAYYRHQARKHEDRNKEWLTAAGGKTAAELTVELADLRTKSMTAAEKAVTDAETRGREAAAKEFAPRMARLAFETALAHVDEARRSVLIENIDLTKVITESGDIDAAKVKTLVGTLAPVKDASGQYDFGQGPRPTPTKGGVGAGAEMYAARRKPIQSS